MSPERMSPERMSPEQMSPEQMSPVDLIQGYLANELSQTGREDLQRWLEKDPAHLDQFVIEVFVDSQLREVLGENKVRQDLLSLACRGDLAAVRETADVPAPRAAECGTSPRQRRDAPKARRHFPSLAMNVVVTASLTACILMVAEAIVERGTEFGVEVTPGGSRSVAKSLVVPPAHRVPVVVADETSPQFPSDKSIGGDQLAVGRAFQPDMSVRLESLTYGERRPTKSRDLQICRSPLGRFQGDPICPLSPPMLHFANFAKILIRELLFLGRYWGV
jgi:hypothetical protein